jgi:hypothetical protein
MDYATTPLIALERELADTERKAKTLRDHISARKLHKTSPGNAVMMRDARLPLQNLSSGAHIDPNAAGTLITDC